MRVVGGALGGRRLEAPGPASNSIRPTSDRAREAIFNMLLSVQAPNGVTVTDLFAGTGALGIEALSRGAAHAAFIDSDPAACRIINANLAGLGLAGRAAVVRSDIESYLAAHSDTVDLAFADPPYGFDRWAELLRTLDAAVLVSDTFGRPWRNGAINVSIGVAGFNPVVSYVGEFDPHGNELHTTTIAVADELAATAELVTGKLLGVPVALIKGYPYERMEDADSRAIVRDPDKDLFR